MTAGFSFDPEKTWVGVPLKWWIVLIACGFFVGGAWITLKSEIAAAPVQVQQDVKSLSNSVDQKFDWVQTAITELKQTAETARVERDNQVEALRQRMSRQEAATARLEAQFDGINTILEEVRRVLYAMRSDQRSALPEQTKKAQRR